jgi:hypothetical protein
MRRVARSFGLSRSLRSTNRAACITSERSRNSKIQRCAFTTDFDRKAAGYSPDRVDALVWALTDLRSSPCRKRAYPSCTVSWRSQQRADEGVFQNVADFIG